MVCRSMLVQPTGQVKRGNSLVTSGLACSRAKKGCRLLIFGR
jgi:hypothetical protein